MESARRAPVTGAGAAMNEMVPTVGRGELQSRAAGCVDRVLRSESAMMPIGRVEHQLNARLQPPANGRLVRSCPRSDSSFSGCPRSRSSRTEGQRQEPPRLQTQSGRTWSLSSPTTSDMATSVVTARPTSRPRTSTALRGMECGSRTSTPTTPTARRRAPRSYRVDISSGSDSSSCSRQVDRDFGLAASGRSLPQLLKNNGFATALVGKWHLGYKPEFSPTAHGFDYFFGFKSGGTDYYKHTNRGGQPDLFENDQPVDVPGYMTDLITDRSVRFIEQNRERPFFIEVAYNAAHFPYQRPDAPSTAPPNAWAAGDCRRAGHPRRLCGNP